MRKAMPDEQPDYTLLDRPEISGIMFYPRRDRSLPPAGVTDYRISVDDGVAVHCRFYRYSQSAPSILYFHGNGEVVSDHDYIAPLYHQIGVNLCVADYRGYGESDGRPSFSSMLKDSRLIYTEFRRILAQEGYTSRLYVMGRSLGALSAIEVAAHFQAELAGLIIESGSAGTRGWTRFMPPNDDPKPWEELRQRHLAKIRSIMLPLLQIHGEFDELIPLDSAADLQAIVSSADKTLLVIPGAGHNDILYVGLQQYFGAIKQFVGD